jgi:hypothetical protein
MWQEETTILGRRHYFARLDIGAGTDYSSIIFTRERLFGLSHFTDNSRLRVELLLSHPGKPCMRGRDS